MNEVTSKDFETLINYYKATFDVEAQKVSSTNYILETDLGRIDTSFFDYSEQIVVYASIY